MNTYRTQGYLRTVFILEEREMSGIMQWYSDFAYTFEKCFLRENRYIMLLNGIGMTVKIALLAGFLGILIGLSIATCSLSKRKLHGFVSKVYTDVIRGTPAVTQLMITYFVVFASVHREKWVIAAIAFAINSGTCVSEIIRAGILSIDKGQTDAAGPWG